MEFTRGKLAKELEDPFYLKDSLKRESLLNYLEDFTKNIKSEKDLLKPPMNKPEGEPAGEGEGKEENKKMKVPL